MNQHSLSNMTPSVRQALEEARQRLEEFYGERLVRVVLYGSQARGDAHPESDVDVLVILRGPVDVLAELKRIAPLEIELLERHGELFSIQPFEERIYHDRTHPLMMNVHEEGIPL